MWHSELGPSHGKSPVEQHAKSAATTETLPGKVDRVWCMEQEVAICKTLGLDMFHRSKSQVFQQYQVHAHNAMDWTKKLETPLLPSNHQVGAFYHHNGGSAEPAKFLWYVHIYIYTCIYVCICIYVIFVTTIMTTAYHWLLVVSLCHHDVWH